MFNRSARFPVMAAKYRRLAKSAADPRERSKFFDYVMIYSQQNVARHQGQWPGETWSAVMFPPDMFPNEETSKSHDLMVDETSSTLRMTADLFERSAAATTDKEKREELLEYAKLYRKMAKLRQQSDAELVGEQT